MSSNSTPPSDWVPSAELITRLRNAPSEDLDMHMNVDDYALYDPCPICDGEGAVETAYYSCEESEFVTLGTCMDCPRCGGKGQVPRE